MSENLGQKELEKYQIQSATEITSILGKLHEKNQLMQMRFAGSKTPSITKILDIDRQSKTFIIDSSLSAYQSNEIRKSNDIAFEVVLDKIKILFNVSEATPMTFEGRPAIQLPLPQKLARLQRREQYRLSVANCLLRIPIEKNGRLKYLDCTLRDISTGGVGFMDEFPSEIAMKVGATYENCLLMLPGTQALVVTVEIRNFAANAATQRFGCQFVNLSRAEDALIQRYIMKLERSRLFNG